MRALRIESFGKPKECVHLREVADPVARDGEVLVRLHAAGLNPSDVANVQGRMPQTTLPRIAGRDFAGVVVDGPKDLLGAEVFGGGGDLGFTREGTHAELVVLPREAVLRRPEELSALRAAVAGVPYVTAQLALQEAARLQPGETLLVVGGTGAVGRAAAQIATWMGARVLATARKPQPETPSVDAWVDPSHLEEQVRELTGGKGPDVVLEMVGGALWEAAARTLAKHGRLASIKADMQRKEVKFDLFAFYRRELAFHGVDSLALGPAEGARALRRLLPGFERGVLVPEEPQPVPLAQASDAYEAVLAGDTRKRAVVP